MNRKKSVNRGDFLIDKLPPFFYSQRPLIIVRTPRRISGLCRAEVIMFA